jgi:adenylate kinase family enzyme
MLAAGKTTLSIKLADSLGIDCFGLDSIVWKPGWVQTSSEERKIKIQDLIDKDSWIIDGVSSQVFQAADTIFFLDIPLQRCLINIVKRFISNGFRTRASLPENCPEYIVFFKAVRIAFVYQKLTRHYLLNLIESNQNKKKIIIIKSYDETPNFTKTLIN